MTAEGVEEEEQLAVLKAWDASIIRASSPAGRSPSRRWSVCLAVPARLNM